MNALRQHLLDCIRRDDKRRNFRSLYRNLLVLNLFFGPL